MMNIHANLLTDHALQGRVFHVEDDNFFGTELLLLSQTNADLTAARFDDTGLHCAVGTSNVLVT